MGFSQQEYWNGLSFPPQGDPPNQGSNPHLLCLLQLAGRRFITAPPRKSYMLISFPVQHPAPWCGHFSSFQTMRGSALELATDSSSHLLTCHRATALEMSLYIVFSSSSLFEEWVFFFHLLLVSAKPELPPS